MHEWQWSTTTLPCREQLNVTQLTESMEIENETENCFLLLPLLPCYYLKLNLFVILNWPGVNMVPIYKKQLLTYTIDNSCVFVFS